MNARRLNHYALSSYAVAALLAACGGSQPPIGAPGAMPQTAALATHAEGGKSWMLPKAKSTKKLLYVSDWATNDVFVYDYANGQLVGQLTGFTQPYGQCVDKKGDVWITSYQGSGAGTVTKYAHGASQPTRALSTGGDPIGCSVDPTSGNLAVSNFHTGKSAGGGNIAVFKNARGSPKTYSNPFCQEAVWPPGYDSAGNLYAIGDDSGFYVCELPHGGQNLQGPVKLNGLRINFPGSAMWDGKYITLVDQAADGYVTTIYQMAESKSGGLSEVGKTVLNDSCDSDLAMVMQPFILGAKNTPGNNRQGRAVVGGNILCSGRFDYWGYPGGVYPTSSLESAPDKPEGQSVSIVP